MQTCTDITFVGVRVEYEVSNQGVGLFRLEEAEDRHRCFLHLPERRLECGGGWSLLPSVG